MENSGSRQWSGHLATSFFSMLTEWVPMNISAIQIKAEMLVAHSEKFNSPLPRN